MLPYAFFFCSAGVGRTGTFIAVDQLIDQGKVSNMVDPAGCVHAMRKFRSHFVQSVMYHVFFQPILISESRNIYNWQQSYTFLILCF